MFFMIPELTTYFRFEEDFCYKFKGNFFFKLKPKKFQTPFTRNTYVSPNRNNIKESEKIWKILNQHKQNKPETFISCDVSSHGRGRTKCNNIL